MKHMQSKTIHFSKLKRIFVRIGRWQEGEGHEGHEAPRHEEEEGRGSGGGADEGHAEEVSHFI